jgi:hypothetical protein
MYTHPNILILIPPSEVKETRSLKSTLLQSEIPDRLYIHELTVTTQHLAYVARLARALHRNRIAVGSITTREPCAAFLCIAAYQNSL